MISAGKGKLNPREPKDSWKYAAATRRHLFKVTPNPSDPAKPTLTLQPDHDIPLPDDHGRFSNIAITYLPARALYVVAMEAKDYLYKIYTSPDLTNWTRVEHCHPEKFFIWNRTIAEPLDTAANPFTFGAADTCMSLYSSPNDDALLLSARSCVTSYARRFKNWGFRGVGVYRVEGFPADREGECVETPKEGWFSFDDCVANCSMSRGCSAELEGLEFDVAKFFECGKPYDVIKGWNDHINASIALNACVFQEGSGISAQCQKEYADMFMCSYLCRQQWYQGKISKISSDFFMGSFPMFFKGIRDDTYISYSTDGVHFDHDIIAAKGNPLSTVLPDHIGTSEIQPLGPHLAYFYPFKDGLRMGAWPRHQTFALQTSPNAATNFLVTRDFAPRRSFEVFAARMRSNNATPSVAVAVHAAESGEVLCEVAKHVKNRRGEAVRVDLRVDCSKAGGVERVYARVEGTSVKLYYFKIA